MTTGFGGIYLGPDAIDQYGCVRCQKKHYADEPAYKQHIGFQSKHGVTRDRDHRLGLTGDVTPDDRLAAIKARHAAATPAPWAWRGYVDGSIELRALHSWGKRIVTTTRAEPCLVELPDEYGGFGGGAWWPTANACDACKAEAEKTQDPWLDYRCPKPENLDTIWLSGDHFIEPSNTWAVREKPYRGDVERIDHPDAEFIAAAPDDIAWLVAEVDRLRSLLEEPAHASH